MHYLSFPGRVVTILTIISGIIAFTCLPSLALAASREGCMNQWLFNGVWRVKITDVQPHMNGNQQQGWEVTEVWRNGTSQQLSPGDTQLKDQILELQNGVIRATDTTGGTLSQGSLTTNNFPPAGEFTYKQVFLASNLSADPSNKPKAVDITFNGALLATMKSKPQFTTSKYDFHFNLGCKATGSAAQAEGGSTQLDAVPGCLNQWMSNGVWKVRVESISPYPPNVRPQDEFMWHVTQTWVNVSGRGIVPRSYEDQGGKFAPTNVTDEFIATQGGKSGSSTNVAGGFGIGAKPGYDWAPGDSYTFTQSFSWGGFDVTDKPIRLLITFDEKAQQKLPGSPRYHKPANFRIDLTCSR